MELLKAIKVGTEILARIRRDKLEGIRGNEDDEEALLDLICCAERELGR